MKKLVIIILSVCLSTIGVLAQKPNHEDQKEKPFPIKKEHPKGQKLSPETKAMMRADILADEIELTEGEKVAVKELFLKQEIEKQKQLETIEAARLQADIDLEKIIGAEKMKILKEKKVEREKQKPFEKRNPPIEPDKREKYMR